MRWNSSSWRTTSKSYRWSIFGGSESIGEYLQNKRAVPRCIMTQGEVRYSHGEIGTGSAHNPFRPSLIPATRPAPPRVSATTPWSGRRRDRRCARREPGHGQDKTKARHLSESSLLLHCRPGCTACTVAAVRPPCFHRGG